jgi:hypothetical protein
MALIVNDRVKETSTTEGTITFNLAGAVTGFDTFVAGIGDTNTTYYAIFLQGSAEWEVGLGTVTDAATDTLARTTVISSSTGSKVDFSAGTKDVFCTLPASKTVFGKQEGTDFTDSLLVGHTTTGTLSASIENTGVGIDTLDALTSADRNTAVGYQAGTAITTSPNNTLVGRAAGQVIATGTGLNTFIGSASGFYNYGSNNVGVGASSLQAASGDGAGYENTGIGSSSLVAITSGDRNAGLGYQSLAAVNAGNNNIGIGYTSGNNITSGDGNVVIGVADVPSATADDQLSISDGEDGSVVWITGESTGNVEINETWNPSLSTTGKALVMGF